MIFLCVSSGELCVEWKTRVSHFKETSHGLFMSKSTKKVYMKRAIYKINGIAICYLNFIFLNIYKKIRGYYYKKLNAIISGHIIVMFVLSLDVLKILVKFLFSVYFAKK